MKPHFAVALGLFAARSLFAAGPAPADQAGAAIARLGAATNYSWTTRIEQIAFEEGNLRIFDQCGIDILDRKL